MMLLPPDIDVSKDYKKVAIEMYSKAVKYGKNVGLEVITKIYLKISFVNENPT